MSIAFPTLGAVRCLRLLNMSDDICREKFLKSGLNFVQVSHFVVCQSGLIAEKFTFYRRVRMVYVTVSVSSKGIIEY